MTMRTFLAAYAVDGINGRRRLLDAGYHPRVIAAKAEKAARRGYVTYGVSADLCWLTDSGLRFLRDDVDDPEPGLFPEPPHPDTVTPVPF